VSHKTGKCIWQHPEIPDYSCPEPALDSGNCIFHEQAKKNAGAFEDGIKRKLDEHDFDFTGCYFPYDVSFEGQHFDDDTSFRYAQFLGGETSFAKAQFSGNQTDFSNTIFSGDITGFHKATFSGERTIFNSALFTADKTYFIDTRFSGSRTYFNLTHFLGNTTQFDDAQFSADQTIFNSAEFTSDQTSFRSAKFLGEKATFGATKFLGKETNFILAQFRCETSFKCAEFSGDHTHFGLAKFLGPKADLRFMLLSSTQMSFSNSELGPCSFIGTGCQRIGFTGTTWNSLPGRPDVCRDEMDAETAEDYARAVEVCRNIKLAYSETGDYERAGEFFYGEMECKRKSGPWYSQESLMLRALRDVCGYGERPLRVIKTWLAVVLSFTLLYSLTGIARNGVLEEALSPFSSLSEALLSLCNCFYFSVVTFTTLGYGDFAPANLLSRILAGAEASLGAFLMALFILVVGRKMLR